MSAENAWRIACSTVGLSVEEYTPTMEGISQDALNEVSDAIRSLPMPPAFWAAVEAEAEKAFEAGVRAGWQFSTEDFNSEMWVGPLSEQQVEDDVVARAVRDRALLSRLEAKGESHE